MLQRFAREAIHGPIEPSVVAAGKVLLEHIGNLAPAKRPATARELLEAVRKALPDLERRAAEEAGAELPGAVQAAPVADAGEW